jgi:CDP-diglyceride synthetase
MAGGGRSGGDDGATSPAGPDGPLVEANGTADAVAAGPPATGDRPPMITVGPSSGSALPHWTEPPTAPTPVAEPAAVAESNGLGEPPPSMPSAPPPAPPAAVDGARAAVKPVPANGTRTAHARPVPSPAAAEAVPPAAATYADDVSAADGPVSGEVPAGGGARWRASGDDWLDGDDFADLVAEGDTRIGALDERDRLRDEQYLTFEDLDVPQADLPTVPPRGSAEDPILIQRTGGSPPEAAVTEAVPARLAGVDDGDADDLASGDLPPGEALPVEADDDLDLLDADTVVPAPPAPPGRDRGQAIKVGLGIALAALAIFLVGALTPLRWLPLLLVVAAIIGAMIELFNAAVGAGYRPVNLVGVAAGAALPVTAYFAGSPTIPNGESGMILVLFLSLVACMAWYLFGAGRGRPVPNIAVTMLGIVYVGVLGSFAALILRAGPWPGTWSGAGERIEQGIPLIILVVIGTELYDAGGYLLGSRLGRTPLSAASPNKTREGLVLGMACAVASVVVLGGVIGIGVQDMTQALILAGVIAVVAPFGDLFESMLKRDLGVKDMSALIPSHGGLLDRVDALLFTLPACYYTLRVLGLL